MTHQPPALRLPAPHRCQQQLLLQLLQLTLHLAATHLCRQQLHLRLLRLTLMIYLPQLGLYAMQLATIGCSLILLISSTSSPMENTSAAAMQPHQASQMMCSCRTSPQTLLGVSMVNGKQSWQSRQRPGSSLMSLCRLIMIARSLRLQLVAPGLPRHCSMSAQLLMAPGRYRLLRHRKWKPRLTSTGHGQQQSRPAVQEM